VRGEVRSHARAVQGDRRRRRSSMPKRHIVVLSEAERARLHTMIGRGVAPASALTMPASCSRPTRARPARAGPTPRSPWRWRSTRPLWPGSAWARSRPGWTPRSTASRPRAPTAAAWTASRGPPGRAGVQRAAGRPPAVEVAAAGRSAGGAGGGRVGVVRDGPAGLAANPLKPWLTEALVHPSRARRRVRLADGGRAGRLSPPL
jgi:hypothetical protein